MSKTLIKWNVQDYELHLGKRRFEYDTDLPIFETILLLSTKRQPSNPWLQASLEIRDACTYYGVLSTNVEIADLRGLEPIQSSCVESTLTIAGQWPVI